MGYELWEEFGGTLPDVIVYPTGGGVGLIGMWKAFEELEAMGCIGRERPRMIAAQAAGLRADRARVRAARRGLREVGAARRPWPQGCACRRRSATS